MTQNFDMIQHHSLTEENISDIMTTALEGGINYWCGNVTAKLDDNNKFVGIPEDMQEEAGEMFLSDMFPLGATLILFDIEDEDEQWELTIEKFVDGFKKTMVEECYYSVQELLDNHDADTADMIILFGLFGEIVYG
jgi:hypothetical protein